MSAVCVCGRVLDRMCGHVIFTPRDSVCLVYMRVDVSMCGHARAEVGGGCYFIHTRLGAGRHICIMTGPSPISRFVPLRFLTLAMRLCVGRYRARALQPRRGRQRRRGSSIFLLIIINARRQLSNSGKEPIKH